MFTIEIEDGREVPKILVFLYFACLHMSVRLYPINVKTAEPIRPTFFVGHHVIPGKVYGLSTFKEFLFINFLNSKSKMSAKPPKILIIENSPSIKNEKKHKSLFGFSSQRLMMF